MNNKNYKDERTEADFELINAVINADFPRIKHLIENKGATPNVYDDFGYPLLAISERHKTQDISDYLVEKGADVNLKLENTSWGDTATVTTVAMEFRGGGFNSNSRAKELRLAQELSEMNIFEKNTAPVRKPSKYIIAPKGYLNNIKTQDGFINYMADFEASTNVMLDSFSNFEYTLKKSTEVKIVDGISNYLNKYRLN